MGFTRPNSGKAKGFRPPSINDAFSDEERGLGQRRSPEEESRSEVERKIGKDGHLMSSSAVSKNINRAMYYYRQKQAFFIYSDSDSKSGAANYGKKFQKSFIARSKLPSSAPPVHDWTMYVGYDGGYIKVDPIKKTERKKVDRGPSAKEMRSEQKREMLDRAKEIFGRNVKITGSGTSWKITVRAKSGEFRPFGFPFFSFDEGQKKLEMAIKMFHEGKLSSVMESSSGKIASELLSTAKSLIARGSVYTGQYSDSSGDMHVMVKFEVGPTMVDGYATVDTWVGNPSKYEVTDREMKHILGGKLFDKRKVDMYAKRYYNLVK